MSEYCKNCYELSEQLEGKTQTLNEIEKILERYKEYIGHDADAKIPVEAYPSFIELILMNKNREYNDLQFEIEKAKKMLVANAEAEKYTLTQIIEYFGYGLCDEPGVPVFVQLKKQLEELLITVDNLEELIRHNCTREGCRYYDNGDYKVFYRCRAKQKLKRIEGYCKEQNLKVDYAACKVLEIIDGE